MKVLIAGGHGQIALELTALLSERGDEVHSLIRNPDHEADVLERGAAQAVLCDLETDDVERVADAVEGMDAVVFAAGAGPGSGSERKETMDYGGAVKLMQAARDRGVRRYVMVSSMGADAEREGDDTFDVYQRAKGRADEELSRSGLAFTIVRPGGLTDDPATGKVFLSESGERGTIPRADVASVLAAALTAENTEGKVFEAVSGQTPIAEAVGAV
jgi:nucleoside-diphosphate-sugar epimerase